MTSEKNNRKNMGPSHTHTHTPPTYYVKYRAGQRIKCNYTQQ
jgi:hypothetical protein